MSRNGSQKRTQLLREELGESFDHAMRAAGHAAGGMRTASNQMRPAAGKMRDVASQRWGSTVSAFNDAAGTAQKSTGQTKQKSSAPAKKMKMMRRKRSGGSQRLPRLAGMLAAGAAVGATAAMVLRRRRQQQWAEYDPNEALEAVGGGSASQAEARNTQAGGGQATAGGAHSTGESGTKPADDLVSRTGGNTSRNSSGS